MGLQRRRWRALGCLPIGLLWLCLSPVIARAETHTFLNTTDLYPNLGAGTYGPAYNAYPSSIAVSGLSGTVTKATVTIIGYRSASPQDTDIVITGPNGQKVFLMSDACGLNPNTVQNDNWTFDDSAPTYLSQPGACANYQNTSFKPSFYLNHPAEAQESPDMSIYAGGPPPPYTNSLSAFNGSSPNGGWNLYVLDDYSAGYAGFDISGWALTLEVQRGPTGLQAAALKKCNRKHGKKRKKCKKKANLLPV